MTDFQIIFKSFIYTLKNPQILWTGLFLSAGFNIHIWYSWFWKIETWFLMDLFFNFNVHLKPWHYFYYIFVVFLISNIVKIWFINTCHNFFHQINSKHCTRCIGPKALSAFAMVGYKKMLGVLLLSFVTIALTTTSFLSFISILQSIETGLVSKLLFVGILFLILGFVSVINLLSVLNILWLDLGFFKAITVSLDFVFGRFKQVLEFMIWTSFCYLVCLALILLLVKILPIVIFAPLALIFFVFGNVVFNLSLVYFLDKYNKPWRKAEMVPTAAQQSI